MALTSQVEPNPPGGEAQTGARWQGGKRALTAHRHPPIATAAAHSPASQNAVFPLTRSRRHLSPGGTRPLRPPARPPSLRHGPPLPLRACRRPPSLTGRGRAAPPGGEQAAAARAGVAPVARRRPRRMRRPPRGAAGGKVGRAVGALRGGWRSRARRRRAFPPRAFPRRPWVARSSVFL